MENLSGDINNLRQNHPELIVRDLADTVAPEMVRQVLKERGVNKWLRVRRLLIQLKARWKDQIVATLLEMRTASDARREYLRGYRKALDDCRQQVRALCHSPRDVDWPTKMEWPESSTLPPDFPDHPNKRWFWRHDGIKEPKT